MYYSDKSVFTMMGTNSNSNLQKQMSCNECNNVLTVKDSIKAWLIDKYVFFCSNDCIVKNTKVEFLDCKICNRSVKFNCKSIFVTMVIIGPILNVLN